MKEIEKHLGHAAQLETHVHGDLDGSIHKITVDCTRCSVEVATIFDPNEGCNEEKPAYLKALVSTASSTHSTFAIICLHEDLVEELLSIRDQLMDLSGQGHHLQVSSFNVSRIGEMNLADEQVVCLKDYDAVDRDRDWDWLHEEVIGPNPPDDFVYDVADSRWDRLTEIPTIDTTETRCIVTRLGAYWEMDARVPNKNPEHADGDVCTYITHYIPWSIMVNFLEEVQRVEDHQ